MAIDVFPSPWMGEEHQQLQHSAARFFAERIMPAIILAAEHVPDWLE